MSGCRSCSGRLFHSVGPAVAKWSPNWLRDLLTKHVRLSADRRGWRPAAVTSVHSSARYKGVFGLDADLKNHFVAIFSSVAMWIHCGHVLCCTLLGDLNRGNFNQMFDLN